MTPLEFVRDILHDLIWAIPLYFFIYMLYKIFLTFRSFIDKITEQITESIQTKKSHDIIETIVKRIVDTDNHHMRLPTQRALHQMSPITKLLTRLLIDE